MKKKIFFSCFLLIALLLVNLNLVYGYSPHYLPGGKNYLSEDNFYFETEG